MVQVGHMRVRMHQLLVSVTVLVPPRDHRLMDVVVVAVGMFVFVIVFDRFVCVLVLVLAAQHVERRHHEPSGESRTRAVRALLRCRARRRPRA